MKKLKLILLGFAMGVIPTAIAATVVFTDITEDDWYYEAVQNLQELGVVEGYDDNTYQAVNNVNRAEIAVMLDRLTSLIQNGCIYEDQIFLHGQTIYDEGGEIASCYEGNIGIDVID